ncbi:MAG: RluA family pseudouridine synthase [Desulfuromonadales bacterium]|nr:RluA family pseudouridine synthase [Desulfuromonadales bacterium]
MLIVAGSENAETENQIQPFDINVKFDYLYTAALVVFQVSGEGLMNIASKVPAPFHGMRVIEYLATRFTYLPEEAWRELVQTGRIFCNGVGCDGTRTVAKDDIIGCDLPDFEAPAVNFEYEVVYEDEWLLGINKPAGLRVHGRGRFITANLIYHVRTVRQPPYPEANLVNRLDADTSGLVLLARDKAVLSQVMQQFAAGAVDKRYLAVVVGCPAPASGTIRLPIGPVKNALVPRFGVAREEGKAAATHYKTVRKLTGNLTLLELHPETGRTHQLRVHLAAIGHPIAGDALYAMNDEEYLGWRRNPPPAAIFQRQALHSHQLQFLHPIHQTICTLTAPLATDMEQFIRRV